jgi:hypothetical protein
MYHQIGAIVALSSFFYTAAKFITIPPASLLLVVFVLSRIEAGVCSLGIAFEIAGVHFDSHAEISDRPCPVTISRYVPPQLTDIKAVLGLSSSARF